MCKESELINKALRGNEKAFEQLMNHYLENLYSYISFKINNTEDVKDIIQEVMLSVYNNLYQYNQKSSFKTWLFSIVRRKIADFYREKYAKENLNVPIEGNENIIENESLSKMEQLSIMDVINGLPDDDKELINLFFIQQFSYKEISLLSGFPIGTVKSKIHYIKEKLKPMLNEWR